MTCCISIIKIFRHYLFLYFNQVINRKDLKNRYFALICLKTNSQFDFTLKDTYNLSYIQTLFFGENVHLMYSET